MQLSRVYLGSTQVNGGRADNEKNRRPGAPQMLTGYWSLGVIDRAFSRRKESAKTFVNTSLSLIANRKVNTACVHLNAEG